MKELLELWKQREIFGEVYEKIVNKQEKIEICGLWGSAKTFFILALKERISLPLLVVVGKEEELETLQEEIVAFEGECSVFSEEKRDEAIVALHLLVANKSPLILTTVATLERKIISPLEMSSSCLTLSPNQKLEYGRIAERLTLAGYEKVALVESKGQFRLQGQILDVWSPNFRYPLRVVLAEDTVEEMRYFDSLSQRSIRAVDGAEVVPAKVFAPEAECTISDYFSEGIIVMDAIEPSPLLRQMSGAKICLSLLPGKGEVHFNTKAPPAFQGQINLLVRELKNWTREGYRTYIFCNNEGEKLRLAELLEEEEVFPHYKIGNLGSGFVFPELKLVVISDNEIFGGYKIRRLYPKLRYPAKRITELIELNVGDYVVHERYGIGRYLGLEQIEIEGRFADYIAIEYAQGDKLYVPIEDFNLVQKYIGTEGYKPKLHSLDGTAWRQVKSRVKKSVQRIARELLEIYSARQKLPGHAFPADSHYEKEFACGFIYETTPDQERAIEEVKQDMMRPKPMDRIVCGDVGYGKTEVAMRASFKAVLDSKQVAVVAPTTILAEQHYRTFSERFAGYPVVIEMLSRFKSKKEQKDILHRLRRGSVDIVIGTHRLLQRDVEFFDLGLVVIDEEQRFGVRDKEKLKQLRKTVDVLTLTATPIPRTLSMALGGVRDMSIINTPPQGRIPIETYVGEYDEEIVKMAVRNEVKRGGQVYYVQNKVEAIERVLRHLKEMLPEIRIAVAHGKMGSAQLERVMLKFINKEYDLLLATTIVETGLDIPNVNTMIITDAHELGLAQLYQLRGRIGRDKYKAYCYIFYPKGMPISDIARKRLETIAQYTELGSGFKIALRDLELRGAGNILGPEQHGHILEVGFDLYCKLLEQAVKAEKGISIEVEPVVEIDLSVDAYIPIAYIPDPVQRISIYRKFASLRDHTDEQNLWDELQDRYGPIPAPCVTLFELVELRQIAKRLGIQKITEQDNEIEIEFIDTARLCTEKFIELAKRYKGKLKFIQGSYFKVCVESHCAGSDLNERFESERRKVKHLKDFLQNLL